MKHIAMKAFGKADVLFVEEVSEPEIAADEVLIDVHAAGVNRPDVIQRMGLYPPPPDASPVLGLEVAGEIVRVGEDVTGWSAGDRVCALVNGGGYAERVAVPASQCLPIPSGLTMVEAAALPETCFTVWSNVFDRAALQPGETFLVHGGSSGIGTTAIQMARSLGATVYTTAGSEAKCEACRKLGAVLAINYHEQDFVEVIRAETNKRGVDVVLDMVGGDYINKNIKVMALDGRLVNIAYLKGAVAEVNFMPVMLKRLTLTGSTLRPQSRAAKASIAKSLREHVWPKIDSGEIRPVIAQTFPLAEASKAHQLMESNAHIGKIVLRVKE